MDDTTCKICFFAVMSIFDCFCLLHIPMYSNSIRVADVLICCVVKEFEYSHYSWTMVWPVFLLHLQNGRLPGVLFLLQREGVFVCRRAKEEPRGSTVSCLL